jgi:hypothetical protein
VCATGRRPALDRGQRARLRVMLAAGKSREELMDQFNVSPAAFDYTKTNTYKVRDDVQKGDSRLRLFPISSRLNKLADHSYLSPSEARAHADGAAESVKTSVTRPPSMKQPTKLKRPNKSTSSSNTPSSRVASYSPPAASVRQPVKHLDTNGSKSTGARSSQSMSATLTHH